MKSILNQRVISFKKSGIPGRLKDSIQKVSNLHYNQNGFFPHLNLKIDEWYSENFKNIKEKISDFKLDQNSSIASRKSLQRWFGDEKNREVVNVKIDNLNVLCLYAVEKTWDEYSEGLTEEEKNLNISSANRKRGGDNKIKFFRKYFDTIERPFTNNGIIDYTRSFSLLLFMFSKEKFKEFRAFDLAIDRWKQLVGEESQNEFHSQIKNYPKDILHDTVFLCTRRNCLNFRRICVIPEMKLITESKMTINILNCFLNAENGVKRNNNDLVFETRVLLCITPDQFRIELERLNDFALFSDGPDEFAIVETSLTTPFEEPKSRVCILLTNKDDLTEKKERFDFLWENYTISLEELIASYGKIEARSNMINDVVNILSKKIGNPNDTSMIVETAYIGLMKRNDNTKRLSHYESAYELIKHLPETEFFPNLKDNVFVNAFVNDFNSIECVENCPPDGIQQESSYNALKRNVTEEVKKMNLSYSFNPNNISTFFMTSTRNRAAKRFKKFMQDIDKKHLFHYKVMGNGNEMVFVNNEEENQICIGYKSKGALIPNCAMIMAEHYFELLEFSLSINPNQTEFWIIDFLQHYEVTSCNHGILLADILYPKAFNVSLNIINCNYVDSDYITVNHHGPLKF